MKLRLINTIFLLLLFSIILTIKFIILIDTIPGIDQVFFISWYQDIANINNIFPDKIEENFIKSIASNEDTLVNQILTKLYNSPDQYFRIINNISFFIFTSIFGRGIEGFNITSIIFNSLVLLFFVYSYLKNELSFYSCVFLILYFGSNNYLLFFSSLGTHNLSLLILFLSIIFLLNQNLEENKIYSLKIWIVIILPFFSHILNAFVITIFFTVLIIFDTKFFLVKNCKFKFLNLLLIFLLFIPFLLISYLSNNFERMITFSEIDNNFFYSLNTSIKIFLQNIIKVFNFHGIILIFLILIFIRKDIFKIKKILIFFLIISLVFISVPGFSSGWERTLIYIYIPLIILTHEILKKNKYYLNRYKSITIYSYLFFFFILNSYNIYDLVKYENKNRLENLNYKFVNTLNSENRNGNLNDIKNSIDFDLENIVFFNYHSLHFYKSIYYDQKNKIFNNNDNIIVETFINRKNIGITNLLNYQRIRGKKFPNSSFVFFLFVPENYEFENYLCDYLNYQKLDCVNLELIFEKKFKYATKYDKLYKLLLLSIDYDL